jgi:hypothetical protein
MGGERERAPPPGELQMAGVMVQGEPPPPEGPAPKEPSIFRFYDEYAGAPLFILAALGAGVGIYRRKPADFFLLAWVMSALAMAQPWVIRDYQWRFSLMLATPIALLAAVGLVNGIGAFLWRLGKNIRISSKDLRKHVTMGGRAVVVVLLAAIVIHQTQVSNTYAWTGEMLQPTISMGQYNTLVEFQEQFGSVYVFRAGFDIYWPDAVGLKADIQGGETVSNLSRILMAPFEDRARRLAVEWDRAQENVGERIYALASPDRHEARVLEDGELFEIVPGFDRPELRVYTLKEDFERLGNRPPGETFSTLSQIDGDQLLFQRPPPEDEESPILKFLLAPIYLLSGSARFLVGIPLTIFMWVLLFCLVWELIRKTAEKNSEFIRKVLVLIFVCIFVLTSVVAVRGYRRPLEELPPPQEGPQPPPGGQQPPPEGGVVQSGIFGVLSPEDFIDWGFGYAPPVLPVALRST